MSNLLDAANVEAGKFTIGKLPTKSGDVSIMTLEQVYEALGRRSNDKVIAQDPTKGYNTSTYYIYAINDTFGIDDSIHNSTLTNLQSISIDWYRELNKPTAHDTHWDRVIGEETHSIFGGPLWKVHHYDDNTYDFDWSYSESKRTCSSYIEYWNDDVSGSVYVVVVYS